MNEYKFLKVIGFMFAAVLFGAFFLTLFGVIDLRIVNEIKLSFAVELSICTVTFMANIFFIFSITMQMFNIKIIKYLLIFLPFYILIMFIPSEIMSQYGQIITWIVPFIFCVTISKNRKLTICCFLALIVIVTMFQWTTGYIKLNLYGMKYYNENALTALLYQIDLFLLYIYTYKVVKDYVGLVDGTLEFGSQRRILRERQGLPENAGEGQENELAEEIARLSRKQRFYFKLMKRSFLLFQTVIVLLIGAINNAFIEMIVMMITFWLSRAALKRCWHSDSLTICSIVTFTGFYILTKLTLPFSISLFSCIALSALFTYLLYRVGILEEEYDELKEYKNQRENFDLKSCTLEQLTERCRIVGIKKDVDFCVAAFCEGKSHKELGEMFFMLEQSAKDKKSRLAKRLNNTL